MKKFLTKRNLINLGGLVSFALGLAIETDIINAPSTVKYATFGIALIGYVINHDDLKGSE